MNQAFYRRAVMPLLAVALAAPVFLAGGLVSARAAPAAARAARSQDAASGKWVRRDERWPLRGPWRDALARVHPQLYREFNGIDYGHAWLAETLLKTRDSLAVDQARREVLDFIWTSPRVAPDEEQIAPTFARLAWEVERTFDWAHALHRSLYDLFASDRVHDKDAAYRRLLADYLASPDAITPHPLDHVRKLWSFEESKSFRDRYAAFNSQIWVYHWLQAAAYEAELGRPAAEQRPLMPLLIERYRSYLNEPPLQWRFMPLFFEVAPEFSRRYPEAAAIFDNLHMAHDNMDDILSRPDLYPTLETKRAAMLRVLQIYLQRNHEPEDRYVEYETAGGHGGHAHAGADLGERPPSAESVMGMPEPVPAGSMSPGMHEHGGEMEMHMHGGGMDSTETAPGDSTGMHMEHAPGDSTDMHMEHAPGGAGAGRHHHRGDSTEPHR